ncbi:flagellar brake protein [Salibacterium halotolerans]|uniref:C-di-GMP-binding flagellar brake protein YcgR, contains PilZNR and PilZ domains n=1 Tax=Salibacterium halotolerans TaxID=1884432 RepID=A0A1I5Q3I6_9BACI|nr:PilZ domain-containing protein [Salibacterium halotolerans]SFP40795.1 c-di-GMP-binding flagellar brake protein YcgR, contains PilZNR and PilZ domains [Salibacterium halotolerans]
MIRIGDTIHLELEEENTSSERGELEVKTYWCKLIDYDNDNNLFVVDPPVNADTGRTGFFMEGVELGAWFVGKDEAVHTFETEVKGRKGTQVRSILLTDPGKDRYIRVQRRNHVRIDTALDAALYPHKTEASSFVTSTIDISGGGMAVFVPSGHNLKQGDAVNAWIVLHALEGGIHYLYLSCTIVRIMEVKGTAKEKCSLRFDHISDGDRQLVIKYCFEQQLQVRKHINSRNH